MGKAGKQVMWPRVDQSSEMRAVDIKHAIASHSSQMPAKSPRSATSTVASGVVLDACAEDVTSCLQYH